MNSEDAIQIELTLTAQRKLCDLVQIVIPRGVGTEIETDDTRIY